MVGVDHEGTIYAYTKALLGKNCLSSHSCVYVKYQIAPLKAVVGVDHEGTIYAYTKALLGKNCLSSHSCHGGQGGLSKIIFF